MRRRSKNERRSRDKNLDSNLDLDIIHRNTVKGMDMSKHDEAQLGKLLDKVLRKTTSAPSTMQKQAIERFNAIFSDCAADNVCSLTHFGSNIKIYFDIFDKLFFFGSLKSKCEVLFVDIAEKDTLGLCTGPYGNLTCCRIRISPLAYGKKQSLVEYLQTLLHEMNHAYFQYYGRWKGQRYHHDFTSTGQEGHGALWQEAAQSIKRTGRQLLGIDFDLGEQWSLACELAKQNKNPRPSDIKPEWNINYHTLLYYIEWIRQNAY